MHGKFMHGGILRMMMFALLLFGIMVGSAGLWFLHWEKQPVYTGHQDLVFEVTRGSSMSQVSRQLSELTGYRHSRVLNWYARYRGESGKIRAGEFALEPGTSPGGFLTLLTTGKTISYPLTIIEGWTFQEMMTAIRGHTAIKQTIEHPDQVMAALGFADQHPEGRFYPDTYLVTKGQTDLEVLRLAHRKMSEELTEAWASRASDLPLKSPDEALILASIIERETGAPEEREQIAGVFIRRLQIGMRLQTDPTVIYGIGEDYEGDITRAHLQTDTPYNTYTRGGLTPTPIALPGRDALVAAVNPADGNSLYFVASGKGDGRHVFSATLEEHNRAVSRYLQRLRQNRN